MTYALTMHAVTPNQCQISLTSKMSRGAQGTAAIGFPSGKTNLSHYAQDSGHACPVHTFDNLPIPHAASYQD